MSHAARSAADCAVQPAHRENRKIAKRSCCRSATLAPTEHGRSSPISDGVPRSTIPRSPASRTPAASCVSFASRHFPFAKALFLEKFGLVGFCLPKHNIRNRFGERYALCPIDVLKVEDAGDGDVLFGHEKHDARDLWCSTAVKAGAHAVIVIQEPPHAKSVYCATVARQYV